MGRLDRLTLRRLGAPIALLGAAAILVATLTPLPSQTLQSSKTPWWCLVCGEIGVVDVLQNILLFMPFGVGLTLLGWRARTVTLTGVAASTTIELLQRFVIAGRDPALGDILANGIGSWAGVMVASVLPTLLAPSVRHARGLAYGWMAFSFVMLGTAASAFRPYAPPAGPYFTLLAHKFPARGHFVGDLQSAQLDTMPLQDAEVEAMASLAEALRAPEHRLGITLVTGEAPSTPAPIVQIVGQANFIIAELNQHESRLIYQPPAHAALLRLRRSVVKIDDVLPRAAGTPARVFGGIENGQMFVGAETASGTRVERYPLTANLAWNLLAGFALKREGPGPWLTTLFVCVWCVPLLTWGMRGFGVRAAIPLVLGAALAATAISRAAHLAWPPWWELVGYAVAIPLALLWLRAMPSTLVSRPTDVTASG